MTKLKVLSVTSEIYPLIKTGGLADVTGALPKALAAEGVDMRTLVPGYPAVLGALEEAQELLTFPGLFGTARLLAGKAHGLTLYVLDAPYLYDRPGNPYTAPDGTDWPDNAYRFGALAKVAAEIGLGLLPAFEPDVVHMHDWQAGLTAAYMHYSGKAAPGMVITVHNLAFQGQFPAELVMPLGLPPASFAMDGVEHYGKVGFLKAALQLADRITTVSPTYAMEIMQPENGMGFDGLLRARSARGERHFERHRHGGVGPGKRSGPHEGLRRRAFGRARRQQGGLAECHGPEPGAWGAACWRGQPPVRAKGHGPAA